MMTDDEINQLQRSYLEQLELLQKAYLRDAEPIQRKIAQLESYRTPRLVVPSQEQWAQLAGARPVLEPSDPKELQNDGDPVKESARGGR